MFQTFAVAPAKSRRLAKRTWSANLLVCPIDCPSVMVTDGMPRDAKIVGMTYDAFNETLAVIVEHPSFAEVENPCDIPEVSASYQMFDVLTMIEPSIN